MLRRFLLIMEKFLHAINSVPGCHWKIMQSLWKRFGDWEYVWKHADLRDITAALNGETGGNLRPRITGQNFAGRLAEFRSKFDADAEFAKLWEKDIAVVSRRNPEYPESLLHLPQAPFLLYRKGAPLSRDFRYFAMVGTRHPSSYGEKMAYDIAEAFARCGAVVVSGLAFGIDAVTHFAAVSSNKPTVAVLACGLYEITPTGHRSLVEEILRCGGTLLSEYPPHDPAYPGRFLERNRIIAGLSEATLVLEAGMKSGALSTARHALDCGRDVYVLPGDITRSQAEGCLDLLAKGAIPIINVHHLLQQLGFSPSAKRPAVVSDEEALLLQCLSVAPFSADELCMKTGFPVDRMNVLLTELDLKGLIFTNKDMLWETAGS